MKTIYSDFLVIGSGLAGLIFAENVCKHGKTVMICKSDLSMTNTFHAQGGIACVLDEADKFESHIQDTMIAGAGLCKEEAVRFMVKKAPGVISRLSDLGVQFDRRCNELELGLEGGHSHHRIVHVKDSTGREVQTKLAQRIRHGDVDTYEHHLAFQLVVTNNTCVGALVLDSINDDVCFFSSKIVFLATGGAGQIFKHTTNPEIATGDGVALSYKAGAAIKDMEFIQFHPTLLYDPGKRPFLITEALRGFGAELKLAEGSPFMGNYHPQGSLAPRDIVARAILTEMQKHDDKCVYLDLSNTNLKEAEKKFPNIFNTCRVRGIEPLTEMIPVVPAAHYVCGGVVTDLSGKTTINGLYAAGEVACTGIHGANRLASNSLLEATVFAEEAALSAVKFIIGKPIFSTPTFSCTRNFEKTDPTLVASKRSELQDLMWDHAGIKRTIPGLLYCFKEITQIEMSLDSSYRKTTLQRELVELRNLIVTAKLIVKASLARTESKGGHYIIPAETTVGVT